MTEIPYVTREAVMAAMDVKPTAYMARQIDRACLAGSRLVDGFCHRTFAPVLATKTFDYPGTRATSRRLWLDQYDLISASSITSGGTSFVAGTDYFLRPDNGVDEPFTYIELNRNGSAGFSGGPQRAISITGLWAYSNREQSAGALSGGITAATASLAVSTPVGGVGSLLRIDSERMLIIGKTWVDSGITASTLTASAASNIITTASAAQFTPFEKLLIDGERVEVLEVAGNSVTVRRAADGSPLAAHAAGAPIFWEHAITVERGVNGTTAATHAGAAPVSRWIPPSVISTLAEAYALDQLHQERSGYARTSGQGENEHPASGRGITMLEDRVRRGGYVRSARTRAV